MHLLHIQFFKKCEILKIADLLQLIFEFDIAVGTGSYLGGRVGCPPRGNFLFVYHHFGEEIGEKFLAEYFPTK